MSAWTDLGDGVHVRQSRAYRMNSGLLLSDDHAALIDPGVLPSELDDIAARVSPRSGRDVTLILTHDHWDHVLGRPWWPDAVCIAHDGLAGAVRAHADAVRSEAARCAEAHAESWSAVFEPFVPDEPVSGQRFAHVGSWRMVFRDAPGHSGTQLTIHLPELRLFFAADMLSDIEIPMLDGDIGTYLATLESLLPLVEGKAIETLVPGHGAVAHGDAILSRLRDDISYLRSVQKGVGNSLAAGHTLEETLSRLDTLSYTGKGATYDMTPIHRANVQQVYDAARSAGGPEGAAGRNGGQPRKRKKRTPEK